MPVRQTISLLGRPVLLLVGALSAVLLAATLIYMLGMATLEDSPRTFLQALEWAAETLTSTGYGGDSGWDHPLMVLFVVVLQFTGVFLVFLILPAYLIPLLERRFVTRLPQQITGLKDHVVVYHSGPSVSTLLSELDRAQVPSIVVEEDETVGRAQLERGRNIIHGSIDDGVLDRVCLSDARALIANGTDDENASLILAARQQGFRGEVLALVEEPEHRQPMILAGANGAFTPRHVLGAALAARASHKVSPRVVGGHLLGDQLELREVRVREGSNLVGKTLAEADLGRLTAVQALGQWIGGELRTFSSPSDRIAANGVLIVVGGSEGILELERICDGATPLRRSGPIVVAGYGEVGKKVVQLLRDVGESVQVIDLVDQEGVDIVGSILDAEVLSQADFANARSAVLALDKDSSILFATVILKEQYPNLPVIARVNRPINVERIHRAGSDFALSISQVSGQILAHRLIGEEGFAVDERLKILKVSSHGLEGRTPAELGIREKTGCSVVAVERDGDVLVSFGETFRFAEGDVVYVCGSREATARYGEVFPRED